MANSYCKILTIKCQPVLQYASSNHSLWVLKAIEPLSMTMMKAHDPCKSKAQRSQNPQAPSDVLKKIQGFHLSSPFFDRPPGCLLWQKFFFSATNAKKVYQRKMRGMAGSILASQMTVQIWDQVNYIRQGKICWDSKLEYTSMERSGHFEGYPR